MSHTFWRLGNNRGERVNTRTANDELRFPAFAVFGNHSLDGFVPAAIAASSDEHWCNRFGRRGHSNFRGHQLAQAETFRCRLLFWHEQSEDSVRAECSDT